MMVPKQAKKVFSGKIFDIYQWEQEQFDGTFATFEMLKRPNTLQVIPVMGDTILLSDEEQPLKDPFISFFGGRQEPNETPLEGIKREFLEETGMVADEWELYKTYMPISKMEWEVYIYIARGCRKVQDTALEYGERITIKPVSFEEFVSFVSSGDFWGKELMIDVMQMQQHSGDIEKFRNTIFGT